MTHDANQHSTHELVAIIREGLDSRPAPRSVEQQAAGLLALERLVEQLEARQRLVDEVGFYMKRLRAGEPVITLGIEQAYDALNPATKTAPAAKVLAHDEPARGGGNQGGSGEPVPASEPEGT